MSSSTAKDSGGGGEAIGGSNSAKKVRQRVSQACDRCRAKKDKCDGKRPSCSTCSSQGQACSYDPSIKKRGLPEGYVRGVEKLIGLVIGKIQGFEDVACDFLTGESSQKEVLKIWNHEVMGEDLHIAWKDSKLLQDLEAFLSNLECLESSGSNPSKRKRESEIEDETREALELAFHRQQEFRIERFENSLYNADILNTDELNSIQQVASRDGHSTAPEAASELYLPSNSFELLNLYFCYCHCWLPVVERHQILKVFHTYSDFTKPSGGKLSNADLAVLFAILAYSQEQNKLQTHSIPNFSSMQLYTNARQFIDDKDYEIGHIQALMLLALIELGQSNWSKAWMTIGQTVRIAIDLGLQHENSYHKRRVHIFLACFALDTIISARLSRVPHLRRRDAEIVGYVDEDGLEEWDPWTDLLASSGHLEQVPAFLLSGFNRLADVMMILNDILVAKQTGKYGDTEQLYFTSKLQSLSSFLPISSAKSLTAPPHHVVVYLAYLATTLAAQRPDHDMDQRQDAVLASTSVEILDVLSTLAQARPSGLTLVLPPFLEYVTHLSVDAAKRSQLHFGQGGLPDFTLWAHKMQEHISTLGVVWTAYLGDMSDWNYSIPTPTSVTQRMPSVYETGTNRHRHNSSLPGSRAPAPPLSPTPVRPNFSRTSQSTMLDIQTDESAEKQVSPSAATLQFQRPQKAGVFFPNDNLGPSDDVAAHGGLVMPVSERTPSFHEDDVDALFRSLAEVDTTEWTNQRDVGLKNFGFADDLAFQAFCNDPDRMFDLTQSGERPSELSLATIWPPPGFFPGHFDGSGDPA